MMIMTNTDKNSIYLSFVACGPIKLFGCDIYCDKFRLCVLEAMQYGRLAAIHPNLPDLHRHTDATVIQPVEVPRVLNNQLSTMKVSIYIFII